MEIKEEKRTAKARNSFAKGKKIYPCTSVPIAPLSKTGASDSLSRSSAKFLLTPAGLGASEASSGPPAPIILPAMPSIAGASVAPSRPSAPIKLPAKFSDRFLGGSFWVLSPYKTACNALGCKRLWLRS